MLLLRRLRRFAAVLRAAMPRAPPPIEYDELGVPVRPDRPDRPDRPGPPVPVKPRTDARRPRAARPSPRIPARRRNDR